MDKEINNNGYEYVDLELPSGTLWATCNVGASKPSEYGLYFQWGDTKGFAKEQVSKDKQFTWDDYKWGIDKNYMKYKRKETILDLEDDAAHVNMGGSWHMPRPKQISELIDNATSAWTKLNGIEGMTFTSKKDTSKFIFIPAAGYAWDGYVGYTGYCGCVFSSMLDTTDTARNLYFLKGGSFLDYNFRYYGLSVRGVIDKNNDNSNGNKINMEKNDDLNIVKILKDAPKGTKLWSPICGECELVAVRYKSIDCKTTDSYHYYVSFTSSGKFGGWVYNNGECVVFPSKDNRDWSTFKMPKSHK